MFLEVGKANTIVLALINLLNEFDIREVIKVILCDTTNTNTGAKGGVVVYLKEVYWQEIRSSTIYWLVASSVRFVIEACIDKIMEA